MRFSVIPAADLVIHPMLQSNRAAVPSALAASVAAVGVLVPFLARDRGERGLEVFDGADRVAAAASAGIEVPVCDVGQLSARGTLERMLVLTAAKGGALGAIRCGRILKALCSEYEMTLSGACALVGQHEEWAAVRIAASDHADVVLVLRWEVAEAALAVPPHLRHAALEILVNPEFTTDLSARQAREIVERWVVAPEIERERWRVQGERLARMLSERTGLQTKVQACDARPGKNEVEVGDSVPSTEVAPAAPARLSWLDLARRHSATLNLYRQEAEEQGKAFVCRERIREAEAALREARGDAWLRAI